MYAKIHVLSHQQQSIFLLQKTSLNFYRKTVAVCCKTGITCANTRYELDAGLSTATGEANNNHWTVNPRVQQFRAPGRPGDHIFSGGA
jgi:hypothetical protein